jgi:rfaE bifunctional protein nucleotidyltransferase chain/domain
MTVRRTREVIFEKDINALFNYINSLLNEDNLYKNTRSSRSRYAATTRIAPGFPLLSTKMSVQLRKNSAQTHVRVETISQPFIIGDIFDMYNGYIDDFLHKLNDRASSSGEIPTYQAPATKIIEREPLAAIVRERQAAGEVIVLTNGCFDLLHLGHVRYLQEARALGDCLVVGVNSDASARRLKGAGRPLVPQGERAEVLAALACVDYVTIFEEATAVALVETLRPNIYVKGGDYAAPEGAASQSAAVDYARLPEAAPVLAYGGQVRLIPYLPDHSTTALIERIIQRCGGAAKG